jgi:hypothetical protein
MIGLKAATMLGTIYFAERLWTSNKAGAIVMMIASNGAPSTVSIHAVLLKSSIPNAVSTSSTVWHAAERPAEI